MGLDSVELVMAFEEEFDIEFPDAEAERIVTVGDAHYGILRKLYKRVEDPDTIDTDDVWERVQGLIQEHIGVDRRKITPDARFIDDLGVD